MGLRPRPCNEKCRGSTQTAHETVRMVAQTTQRRPVVPILATSIAKKNTRKITIKPSDAWKQAQAQDPTFVLPFLDSPLPISEIHSQLKLAKTNLTTSQSQSTDLRYRCYNDLLATYADDTDPSTQKESERRAKIVTNTIKSEQCRSMNVNIRSTVKPGCMSSLSRLLVPHTRHETALPHNFQEFLASTSADDIQLSHALTQ